MNTAHKAALLSLLAVGCAVDMSTDVSLDIFDKDPDAIDVSTGAQIVTCDMTITATGGRAVQFAACSFVSPGGRKAGCLAVAPVGDLWSCDLEIQADAEDNTWTIEYVFAQDDLGAKLYATGAELVADAANVLEGDATRVDLDVQSAEEDVTPPTITSFVVYPLEVIPGEIVTVDIGAADTNLPLKDTGATFLPDNASPSVSCSTHGAATCLIGIDPAVGPGVTYTEVNHFARDNALNVTIGDLSRTFATISGAGGAGGASGTGGTAGAGGFAGTGGAGGTAGAGGATCDGKFADVFVVGTTPGVGDWSPSQPAAAAPTLLTFETYATSSVQNSQAIIAISDKGINTWSDAPMLVRFNDSGFFDVMHGQQYACSGDCDIPWVAGTWYKIRITADMATELYSVTVGTCDETPVPLITDADFRFDSVPRVGGGVDRWALWALDTTLGVQGVSWVNDCVELTCADYDPDSCGAPPDGCGGPLLSCGTCVAPADVCDDAFQCCDTDESWCANNGKDCDNWTDNCDQAVGCGDVECGDGPGGIVCNAGVCCTPSTTRCTDPDPDYVCGLWSDGCGGTVNCDNPGCSGGTPTCDPAGQCVAGGALEPENETLTVSSLITFIANTPPNVQMTKGAGTDLPTLGATEVFSVSDHQDGHDGTYQVVTITTPNEDYIVEALTGSSAASAGEEASLHQPIGDSWETIYEACSTDDYPTGFRPEIFVRPTLQNTGANCSDTGSGCPDETLVEWTAKYPGQGSRSVDAPGVYENFYIDNALRINASNVTLRNFILTCNDSGPGLLANDQALSNFVAEYGTIQKGSFPCQDGIWTGIANSRFSHIHIDQHKNDGINSGNIAVGHPVIFERGLITRPGDNGGYGSDSHSDVWQYWNVGGPATGGWSCWLGSRVVPSYCSNHYKSSNVTQSSIEPPGKQYVYNNWLDGSTNVMIGGDGRIIRNNKFGNLTAIANYWGGNTDNQGGNTYECDGSPLTDGQWPNLQPTCPWGYDNDPVIGWDGENVCGLKSAQPCDGQNNPINCTGTVDSQPVDPTEFCISDGSGCIVTPTP